MEDIRTIGNVDGVVANAFNFGNEVEYIGDLSARCRSARVGELCR